VWIFYTSNQKRIFSQVKDQKYFSNSEWLLSDHCLRKFKKCDEIRQTTVLVMPPLSIVIHLLELTLHDLPYSNYYYIINNYQPLATKSSLKLQYSSICYEQEDYFENQPPHTSTHLLIKSPHQQIQNAKKLQCRNVIL
jgi:hypothetical protein